MKTNTPDHRDLRSRLDWKVALASGVIIGAGFGAVALVQADQQAIMSPEAIELRAENSVLRRSAEASALLEALPAQDAAQEAAKPPAAKSAHSVASPDTKVASPAKKATPKKFAAPPAAGSTASVASPATCTASPASVTSPATVVTPASVASPASVDSPDSVDS